jgi:hypothetical protein
MHRAGYSLALATRGPDDNQTKHYDQMYSHSLDYGLFELGRLFLAIDFATGAELVCDPREPAVFTPRQAVENLWLAQPLSFDDVAFLARAYADGQRQEQPRYAPWFPVPDMFDAKEVHTYREHRMIVRWVRQKLLETDREKITAIHGVWESWTLCRCVEAKEGLGHKMDCTILVAIKTLQYYQQCLDAAWSVLQDALSSPTPKGFAGWENGPRVYHELGLSLT